MIKFREDLLMCRYSLKERKAFTLLGVSRMRRLVCNVKEVHHLSTLVAARKKAQM
jgi:hypothetical protein